VNISAEALAATCARVAEERRAEDIVVLHVAPLTTIADYFVIATARNVRQLKAICDAIRETLDLVGADVLGVEGEAESGWVLIDTAQAVVHLFSAEARSLYALEMLWGEGGKLDWTHTEPLALEGRP